MAGSTTTVSLRESSDLQWSARPKEGNKTRILFTCHWTKIYESNEGKLLLFKIIINCVVITIVRIKFSPLVLINVSNGHFYTLETTDKDQIVVTSDIWTYCNLYLHLNSLQSNSVVFLKTTTEKLVYNQSIESATFIN